MQGHFRNLFLFKSTEICNISSELLKVSSKTLEKVDEKIIRDKDGYGKYEKPDDSDFDEPSKTKNESNYKKMMEIIK